MNEIFSKETLPRLGWKAPQGDGTRRDVMAGTD